MPYRVCGAAAVVEMDDSSGELNTGPKVYLEEGGIVPEGAKPASVEHLLSVGLIEDVNASDIAADGDAKSSRRSTAKAE